MTEGFQFENAEAAMQFYELCQELGAKTLEERTAVLRLLVKNKRATYLRNVESHAKDKKVLKIMRKRENPSA